jgi:DNA-binding winged helix-turn-helix (wHTH) protein/tetratricopeptide (TPR) repeat protein
MPQRLFFEDFELRLDSGELFQGGAPVKLQPQPAKVLEALASRSGEVASREEIRQLVWGDAFVDFDASLNFCIKEIRRALGDSATSPRFVETVPRRGYRFLLPVRTAKDSRELPLPAPPPAVLPAPKARRWPTLGVAAGMAVGLLILLIVLLGTRLHQFPSSKDRPKTEPKPPSEPANEAYLWGVYLLKQEEYEKAEASFQETILLDPNFAPAYPKLAKAQLMNRGKPQKPEIAEAAVRHALELDPGLADAHALLGQLLFGRLDWNGARREIQTALAADPWNADAHLADSLYLQALGRNPEAIAAVKRARELDPAGMVADANLAWYLYLDHQYEEAIRQARKVVEIYPLGTTAPREAKESLLVAQDTILSSAWMLGDRETALAAAKGILEALGKPEEANRLRNLDEFWRGREQRIQEALRTMAVDPYTPAKNAMVMGERERALTLLSRCAPKGSLAFPFAAVEPLFEELHDDPRWPKVLDCLKLPAPARDRAR